MKSVKLPWGAWYQDDELHLELPDDFQIDYYQLENRPALSEVELAKKLDDLESILKPKKAEEIIIVVDDLTRPVILEPLLKVLLHKLTGAGVPKEGIKFLVGLGSHRPLSKEEMAKKIGRSIVDEYSCLNHNPQETMATGLQWGKTELKLNKYYLNADFRIVISGLTPHSFAGFSGGAKMLIPGISDLEIISKTHKSVLMGFMGKLGEVENNKFRAVIEELVQKIGLEYFIGVVINGNRTLADVFTGDFKEAHRLAAAKARRLYLTTLKSEAPYDLLVLNAFPKDTELLQAENAFIPLKSAGDSIIKENGIVLVTSACSEGLGYHGLFGPQGLLYRKPRPLRFLKGRKLIFYSPNISEQDFYTIFHDDYQLFTEQEKLSAFLEKHLPSKARVAVFPLASLQLARK